MKPPFRHLCLAACSFVFVSASTFAADWPAPIRSILPGHRPAGDTIYHPDRRSRHCRRLPPRGAGAERHGSQADRRGDGEESQAKVIATLSGPTPSDAVQNSSPRTRSPGRSCSIPTTRSPGRCRSTFWPTIAILAADGTQAGHLAGLSQSFASDLGAYRLRRQKDRRRRPRRSPDNEADQLIPPSRWPAGTYALATCFWRKTSRTRPPARSKQGSRSPPADRGLRVAQVEAPLKAEEARRRTRRG